MASSRPDVDVSEPVRTLSVSLDPSVETMRMHRVQTPTLTCPRALFFFFFAWDPGFAAVFAGPLNRQGRCPTPKRRFRQETNHPPPGHFPSPTVDRGKAPTTHEGCRGPGQQQGWKEKCSA